MDYYSISPLVAGATPEDSPLQQQEQQASPLSSEESDASAASPSSRALVPVTNASEGGGASSDLCYVCKEKAGKHSYYGGRVIETSIIFGNSFST